MPQLRVKNGPDKGKTYPLSAEAGAVQLGREAAVAIHDSSASRHHAEVFVIGDMYFLRDLGSRNGTFVNDDQVGLEDQVLLQLGDLIRIGSTRIVFEEPGPVRMADPQFADDEVSPTAELRLETAEEDSGEPETAEADVHFPILFRLARACSSAPDVKALMHSICEITLEASPAEEVYIFVRQAGKLEPVAHKRREKRDGELRISSTIIKRALRRRRAILVSDAQHDTRFSASSSVIMKGIRSVICAPLAAHEHTDGALYLHSSTIENAFTDDHLRLVTAIALQAGVAIGALRAHEESRGQLLAVLRTLVSASEDASPTAIKGHSDRVRALAGSVAKALELSPADTRVAELAGLLHAVGRIAMPEGALDREGHEFDYATLGAELIRKFGGMDAVAAAVAAHRERIDGSGGPRQLIGHQIPRAARIVGLVDEFDRRLMDVSREVQGTQAVKRAVESLTPYAGETYDKDVFHALLTALRTNAPRVS